MQEMELHNLSALRWLLDWDVPHRLNQRGALTINTHMMAQCDNGGHQPRSWGPPVWPEPISTMNEVQSLYLLDSSIQLHECFYPFDVQVHIRHHTKKGHYTTVCIDCYEWHSYAATTTRWPYWTVGNKQQQRVNELTPCGARGQTASEGIRGESWGVS